MTGRGRGRGNGGRGRGNTSGRSNSSTSTYSGGSNKTNYKPLKKTLSDHICYLGSAKQAADFGTTTEFILNHIKKTFNFGNDIATAIDNEQPYSIEQHKPVLKFSMDADGEIKDAANEQYKMEFKAEYDG